MIRTITRFPSPEALRLAQLRAWQALPSAARLDAAWELVLEYHLHHNRPEHELRLQRTVTAVRRS